MPWACFVCLLGTSLCRHAPLARSVSVSFLTPHLTELLFDIGAGIAWSPPTMPDISAEGLTLPGWVNYRSISHLGGAAGPEAGSGSGLALRPGPACWARSSASASLSSTREPTGFASRPPERAAWGTCSGSCPEPTSKPAPYLTRLSTPWLRAWRAQAPSVFYQLWYPPLTSINSTWPGQAITLCGGRKYHGEDGSSLPQVGLEQVIKGNPGLSWLAAGILPCWITGGSGPCWTPSNTNGSPSSTPMNCTVSPPRLQRGGVDMQAIEDAHTGQGAD